MDQLEKVEKLRKKTNVSYEEAKAALEANNWNMLDAIVHLEKQGKVNGHKNTSYSTHYEEPEHFEKNASQYEEKSTPFRDSVKKFFKWCGNVIKKGNAHYLDIEKKGEHFLSVPITLLAIFVLIAFWAVIILLVIGLFLGCGYSFRGPNFKADNVNSAMDKASQTAEHIKNDFKNGFND